ncbi:MAG: 30S ribosomal protein S5 [Deferribacteraceae bacterium]|jgi:small subunit ribosomal protein S5|nr:30S ribosomal protein S5 [Deferribacteraceae bacterium]
MTEEKQFADKIVHIGRVTKVVKGGRIFKFTALVVVGDRNGKVGVGHGKAREVPDAIRKALEAAKKNIISIPVVKGSIPHEVLGCYRASEIVMKPAAPGTGIIAGGAVRSLFELAGVHNILAKSVRSRNPFNSLYAALNGFSKIRTVDEVAEVRNKDISELIKINQVDEE